MDVMKTVRQHRLVPVVVFEKLDDVEPVLGALNNGGLPIAEITFRTACAAEAIELGIKKFPQMLIGAGTVINAAQCGQAIRAGARFIVGPGFSEEVAQCAQKAGLPYIPGVVTPTEIIKAVSYGINLVKFFPASDFGGLKTIKALSAAFPSVSFMPTGGVTADNMKEYLAFQPVVACGGSFMMKGAPADIESATKQVMAELKQ